MNLKKSIGVVALAVVTLAVVGCMPKMTIEEMRAMMPERPVELDHLNTWIGTWVGEGEAEMAGLDESIKATSESTTEWGCDGWCVIERGKFEMEGFDPMEGIGLWTYDIKAKKFRGFWVDSMGTTSVGTATYSPETQIWKMKGKSRSAFGKTVMRGSFTIPDPDSMEWSMTEYDGTGLFKTMEMTGKSRRKQ
jgi:hypothetical protein